MGQNEIDLDKLVQVLRDIRAGDIYASDLELLLLLHQNPEGLNSLDIQRITGLGQSGANKLCARLGTDVETVRGVSRQVGNGWITREKDPDYPRAYLYVLTKKGRQELKDRLGVER